LWVFLTKKACVSIQISPKCLRPRNRSNIRRRLARQRNRFLGLSFWGNFPCDNESCPSLIHDLRRWLACSAACEVNLTSHLLMLLHRRKGKSCGKPTSNDAVSVGVYLPWRSSSACAFHIKALIPESAKPRKLYSVSWYSCHSPCEH